MWEKVSFRPAQWIKAIHRIFSRYLAGHPEKNMLIDIYDGSSGKVIGEYGFGGFKLFTAAAPSK